MSTSPGLVQCITTLRYACSLGNTGKSHFFRDTTSELIGATARVGFLPPHFGTPLFPKEFVGCRVPVLSESFLKPEL